MTGSRKSILLLLLPLIASGSKSRHHNDNRYHYKNNDFDYFMLTQIYPPAVCWADDAAVPDSCDIPYDAAPWTIHGLW